MRALALVMALFALATPPALGQAQRFVLDGAHTQVAFSIERFGFNHVLGRFDQVEGELMLDQAAPENSIVSATIQTASISTGSDLRNEHLRGDRWLNAAQFPTMTFRSTSVARIDDNAADVVGDMTIHGVTQPVTLRVTLNQIGTLPNNQQTGAGFSATGVISRAAFGINTAPNLIGDEIRITIEALGQAPPS